MARVEGQSAKGRAASSATRAVWALCPSSGVEPWAFCPAQATWRASPSWVQVQVTAPSKARAWKASSTWRGERPRTVAWALGGTMFSRVPPEKAATRGRAVSWGQAAWKVGW